MIEEQSICSPALVRSNAKVLDACCGSRMFWFNPEDPRAIFVDKRKESRRLCDGREMKVDPDMVADFTNLPFADESFKLVVFDPPHLDNLGDASWMAAKYGQLVGDWREELRSGFRECFRVLEVGGTLIFKWNETRIKTSEILKLTDRSPLFGHISGRRAMTHWVTFIKE